MIKALFFDIDGTLVSFRTHQIPTSTVQALTEARRRGVRVFIATGRPMHFINNLSAITPLIDGYMTTNGAQCFIGDREVRLTPIRQHDVDVVLAEVNARRLPCVVVSTGGFTMLHPTADTDAVVCGTLNLDYRAIASPLDVVMRYPVTQLTPFWDETLEREVLARTEACTSARWYPAFSDVTAAQADKGQGLEVMAAAAGISVEETMAFGDGGNDIPLLRRAGIGVAMGNALPHVQSAADYVTAAIDEDGVAVALRHFDVV